MGQETRMQIAELQALSEGDEHWFAGVCADITNGASVDKAYANLCAVYDVSWGAVSAWINVKSHPERREQWNAALAARKLLREERASANIAKIAAVEHPDGDVSVADTLKAAGLVLNVERSGVTVNVDARATGEVDIQQLARKTAFLLRKGIEEGEVVDAVPADVPVLAKPERTLEQV